MPNVSNLVKTIQDIMRRTLELTAMRSALSSSAGCSS